jgi:hypothetical protein
MFRNNQQKQQFLSVYYFTQVLLHVSATVCHPQGARLYLLSYMPIWVLVDKIVCGMWLCVRYVAAWCLTICRSIRTRLPLNTHTATYHTKLYQPKPKLACNSEGIDELPEDATQLPKHVAAAK